MSTSPAESQQSKSSPPAPGRADEERLNLPKAQWAQERAQAETWQGRLTALMDSSPDGVVVLDARARVVVSNAAAERICGRPIPHGDDYEREGGLGLCHPDGTPCEPDRSPLTRAAVDGQTQQDVEMSIVRGDGRRRDVRVNAAPTRDGRGRVTGAVAVLRDVTDVRTLKRRLEQTVQERTAELAKLVDTLQSEAVDRRSAEAALQEANELLERVFSSIHLMIAHMDTGFNFIRVNRAYALADGREPEFFVGKNHFELYPDAENETSFRRVVETGQPYAAHEKAFIYPANPERGITYWDWTVEPVRGARGAVTSVVLCLRDVTERKQAQLALQESEQRFRQMAEAVTEVIWIASADRSRIIYVNPAYERIWGRGCPSLYEDPASWPRAIHPEDRGRVLARIATLTAPGSRANYLDNKYRVVRPDRSMRVVRDRIFPIRNSRGEVYRLCGIAEDVTDKERADEARSRLAAIVQSSEDAVVGESLAGTIVAWNAGAERIHGYLAAEMIGQSIWRLVPAERLAEAEQLREQVRQARRVEHVESVRLRKDGERINVSLTISPIRGPDGTVTGISTIARDITERKRLEKEILEISQTEQHRIGRDLHDTLGQNLTAIAFLCKVLQQKLSAKSAVDPGEAERMAKLANETISQARAIARGLCPVDLSSGGLADALEALAADVTAVSGIDCQFKCHRPIDMTDGPAATQLYFIAREAVNNAVKHARASKVVVRLGAVRRQVLLAVRDDGVGLGKPKRGEGVGLAIMNHRAQMIGGRLDIRRAPRGGTVVVCRVQT